ncbi:Uncharacterized protein APZ42_004705 [Daphnia magna]|uniref:Uncharacterized protein n=1 Tax=Daphnia magna TaxID=35525 RepID=A0A164GW44_9CRUS|nr:Uncharacterized protein APZ42_004705 [Daphnia magna]
MVTSTAGSSVRYEVRRLDSYWFDSIERRGSMVNQNLQFISTSKLAEFEMLSESEIYFGFDSV